MSARGWQCLPRLYGNVVSAFSDMRHCAEAPLTPNYRTGGTWRSISHLTWRGVCLVEHSTNLSSEWRGRPRIEPHLWLGSSCVNHSMAGMALPATRQEVNLGYGLKCPIVLALLKCTISVVGPRARREARSARASINLWPMLLGLHGFARYKPVCWMFLFSQPMAVGWPD